MVCHVFRKFISISQGWVGKDMWRHSKADERVIVGVMIVGVMRLTATSCCLWEAAGLDDAGVRGFGGACMIHPIGPIWVLDGGDIGVGSVDRGGCWG